MGTKTVKISTIKKDLPKDGQSLAHGLAKKGYTRMPGTAVFKFPYKLLSNNKYLTGLDENADYLKRILSNDERQVEIDRIKEWRKIIAQGLGIEESVLAPHSPFWNHTKFEAGVDETHVTPVKLIDGDNYFNLDNVRELLDFAWLRVHPTIASSLQAYERGEYPSDTQFYVSDDEIENEVKFKKKQVINKAIAELSDMTPAKRRKVARMMGFPISDDSKDSVVYNLIDDTFKSSEIKTGLNKGSNPLTLFNSYAHMKEDILEISDLVEQAILNNIYRIKDKKIFKGDYKFADTKANAVTHLLNEDNQEDLMALKDELKMKKLASV